MDVFAHEAVAFVNGFDLLRLDHRASFADLPDKAKARTLICQAEWLGIQRTNPFMDCTLTQLYLLDLAECFLRWCAEPTSYVINDPSAGYLSGTRDFDP